MFKPSALQKGDQVAIVSTARKVSMKEIQPGIDFLKSIGLAPILGKTIDRAHHQFAGTDQERSEDFQQMLDDDKIKAIWCARGGYGTVRIIDKLDFTKFQKQPKWIIGYSDITVLHSHIHNLGVQTLHAPMAIDLHKSSDKAKELFQNVLLNNEIPFHIASNQLNKTGKCKGKLVGGNLSILYSLCGSSSAIDTKGKILFIEDLDEYLYHVDRMLQNLKRNGYFKELSGLIVGGMTNMHDNTVPFGQTAEEIILDAVSEYDFPVIFDFPAGHVEDNSALLLGTEVELKVSQSDVTLNYLS